MPPNTHGRWPLLAAGAVLPVTAAALRHPPFRPWAGLLWHQTEEWVWPGGFLPWLNRDVIGSDEDEFPLGRREGFFINVVLGWGLSLTTIAGARAALPSAMLYTSHLGNVALHLSWAVRKRRYDPGSVTAAATLLPLAIAGLRGLMVDPAASRRAIGVGVAGGSAASMALLPAMRRRLSRSTHAAGEASSLFPTA